MAPSKISWRTKDGVSHRLSTKLHGIWIALCGADLNDTLHGSNDPIDCMTCIVKEARRDAA